MAGLGVATLIGAFALLAALSALATWRTIRLRILDVPNRRSSHQRPVPRLGGVAIVAAFLAGLAWIAFSLSGAGAGPSVLWGLAAAGSVVALVGLADDLGAIRGFAAKLAGQLVAAAVLLGFGVTLREVSLPGVGEVPLGWWGYPIAAAWIVALTNMVNFMDGLDGLAGGTGVIAGLGFAAAAALSGSTAAALLALTLAAACLGFTLFNTPRARIFMGDVGSQFLGFNLAALAVIAAEHDAGHTSLLVMPLLMFHFIFDTVFTFFRRLAAGDEVTQAHRKHLYQLMNRLGASHFQVSVFHWGLGLAQAIAAAAMLSIGGSRRILIFVPFLVFEIAYASAILTTARRKGVAGD